MLRNYSKPAGKRQGIDAEAPLVRKETEITKEVRNTAAVLCDLYAFRKILQNVNKIATKSRRLIALKGFPFALKCAKVTKKLQRVT
ncbi:MAG: hypothetical protein SOR61_03520 [Evtepia sp.]|nr:hypothetical protein [Evtepia sp.]